MKISQIALQLYTLRQFCQTGPDLAATARKVRAIGYEAVQISGIGPIPAPEVRAIMDDAGLCICATHEPGPVLLQEPAKAVERLHQLGCTLTAYPYPGTLDLMNPEVVVSLAAQLDRTGAILRENGLTLGYHNHAHEFVRFGAGTVLDYLYAHTAPENLVAELDTYWVQYGGGNVLEWVARMAGRLPFIHLKDYKIKPDYHPTWCEIGAGVLPFRRIIAAAEAGGCRWFIVEQDTCEDDPFATVTRSFRQMVAYSSDGGASVGA